MRIHKYCEFCQSSTIHHTFTTNRFGETGIERGLSAILTLGISEIKGWTLAKCQRCGRITKIK